MNHITLSRRFFKEGLVVFLALILLGEGLAWSSDTRIQLMKLDEIGGILKYAFLYIKSLLLPEIMTVLVLTMLMYWVRRWLGIRSVALTWGSIGRYELLFLPVMLVAFLFINPFTQSVRYLLVFFPDYSFDNYWNIYIVNTFNWRSYFTYLFPILLIGYSALNLSLLLDYIKPKHSSPFQ